MYIFTEKPLRVMAIYVIFMTGTRKSNSKEKQVPRNGRYPRKQFWRKVNPRKAISKETILMKGDSVR